MDTPTAPQAPPHVIRILDRWDGHVLHEADLADQAADELAQPPTIFAATRACALALLAGSVLAASDVTAGNGLVVDWRTVKSGEALITDADPFDEAHLFVAAVGPEAAILAATRDKDVEPAPEVVEHEPRVVSFMLLPCGGRRRMFKVGPFAVYVEPHGEDDAAQAAFVTALAAMAGKAGAS